MRFVLFLCGLSVLGTNVGAEDQLPRTTVGVRAGIGTIDLPFSHSGPAMGDFGAHVERMFSAKDSLFASIGYARVSNVGYFDDHSGTQYAADLASALVGVKSRVSARRSGPYAGVNVGVTRWSGRPGDIRWSPTIAGIIGVDFAVQARSKVFTEAGVRAGNAALPHWTLSAGYATGF
jgi:hypothetical protein